MEGIEGSVPITSLENWLFLRLRMYFPLPVEEAERAPLIQRSFFHPAIIGHAGHARLRRGAGENPSCNVRFLPEAVRVSNLVTPALPDNSGMLPLFSRYVPYNSCTLHTFLKASPPNHGQQWKALP